MKKDVPRYLCFAWVGGVFIVSLPTLLVTPLACAFFYRSPMSKPTFVNSNVVYHDHSTEYHIDARGNQHIDAILRACEKDQVDDIKPAEPKAKSPDLPFLVVEKLKELNLYTLEEFEEKYRNAVKGDAKTLAKFLKDYRDLHVLDFQGKDKKQILAILQERFPDDINYGYTNFATYF